ncbi:superoxide dismutase [Candidatus Saccharibacteria bacterium]|nr:superoxide dismutase [Candidatus Saccharibacteria bacterium]
MFKLPDLGYGYDALEPYIDAKTMEIHHSRHHQAYIDKLNEAVGKYAELEAKTVEELLSGINNIPEDIRTAVQNHGGGHHNHTLFWESMKPGGGSTVPEAIEKTFGNIDDFKAKMTEAAIGRFGSGWAWLVKSENKLEVYSTANQDSPLMEGKTPILGLDVWEHAYYLKYQSRRPDYVEAWWRVVNWDVVANRLKA